MNLGFLNIDILSLITFLPLVGAGVLMLLRIFIHNEKQVARWVALAFSLVVLVLAVKLFADYAGGRCPRECTPRSDPQGSPSVFACRHKAPFCPLIHANWRTGSDPLDASVVRVT